MMGRVWSGWLRLALLGGLLLGLLLGCAAAAPTGTPAATRVSVPTATLLPSTATPSPTITVETAPPATEPATPVEGSTGNADVLFVRAREANDGSWTFEVTVEHPDTGWEDYADGWDVITTDGEVLRPDPDIPFTRLLLHPHESEQPFTRSQGGIVIPDGVNSVRVRAHDLVDGWGGREVVVDLNQDAGSDFEVMRVQ
jgi:hypothetical protein